MIYGTLYVRLDGVVAVKLEGIPPMSLRVLVDSEAAGEWLIENPLLLLADEFATVWIPGYRTVVIVPRR